MITMRPKHPDRSYPAELIHKVFREQFIRDGCPGLQNKRLSCSCLTENIAPCGKVKRDCKRQEKAQQGGKEQP